MRGFWVVALAAGLLAAGCLGASRRASDDAFSVPLPTWHAGYEWRYTLTGGHSIERLGPAGDRVLEEWHDPPTDAWIHVFNTTRSVMDRPAYFAWLDERPTGAREDPRWVRDGTPPVGERIAVAAYRAEDLARVGLGSFAVLDAYPSQAAAGFLQIATGLAELPGFQFPLHEGQEWDPPTDDAGYRYVARVLGRETVEREDGSHAAVRVSLFGYLPPQNASALALQFLPTGVTPETGQLRATRIATYWWGEQEANLLRSEDRFELVYDLTGRQADGVTVHVAGHDSWHQERDLASARLVQGFEAPVPVYSSVGVRDAELDGVRRLIVRHNGGPDPDVGAGPMRIRFHLEQMGVTCASCTTHAAGAPAFNEARFKATWTLYRFYYGAPIARSEGPEFFHEFEEAGIYIVRAEIHDGSFDAVVARPLLTLAVSWTGSGQVDAGPGLSQDWLVLNFELPWPGAVVGIQFGLSPDTPAGIVDEGSFVLRYPGGFEEPYPADDEPLIRYLWETGTYEVLWQPDRAVAVGDDPYANARLSYPPTHGYPSWM